MAGRFPILALGGHRSAPAMSAIGGKYMTRHRNSVANIRSGHRRPQRRDRTQSVAFPISYSNINGSETVAISTPRGYAVRRHSSRNYPSPSLPSNSEIIAKCLRINVPAYENAPILQHNLHHFFGRVVVAVMTLITVPFCWFGDRTGLDCHSQIIWNFAGGRGIF
jgi:hypothetical protein